MTSSNLNTQRKQTTVGESFPLEWCMPYVARMTPEEWADLSLRMQDSLEFLLRNRSSFQAGGTSITLAGPQNTTITVTSYGPTKIPEKSGLNSPGGQWH